MATLQDAVNWVRSILDEPQTNLLTDNDFLYYARTSLAEAFELAVKIGSDYYLTKTTINATSGQNEYTLPTDFGRVEAVFWGENRIYEGGEISVSEDTPKYFRISSNKLILFPIPNKGETITLYYHRRPSPPSALTDEIDVPEPLLRFFELDLAIQAALKGGYDISQLEQKKELERRNRIGFMLMQGNLKSVKRRGF